MKENRKTKISVKETRMRKETKMKLKVEHFFFFYFVWNFELIQFVCNVHINTRLCTFTIHDFWHGYWFFWQDLNKSTSKSTGAEAQRKMEKQKWKKDTSIWIQPLKISTLFFLEIWKKCIVLVAVLIARP